MFPQNSIASALSPATQTDILGILQREQDRAAALLSSSPLLASLFVSYANQAAAFESASTPPSSEEWNALENTISTLQEEVDKLRPENLKMAERLEAAAGSLDAFRSQVVSLKETNTIQQDEIKTLRAQLAESKDKHNRLEEDSNAERDTLRSTIADLEVQRGELKDTVVQQQLKISKLERHSSSESDLEIVTGPASPELVSRQSAIINTTNNQERQNQREGVIEGLLGSGPTRRRNDSAKSQMTAKPAQTTTSLRLSGWDAWGNAGGISVIPERAPSPELPTVKPKIEPLGSIFGPGFGRGTGKNQNLTIDTTKPPGGFSDIAGPENIPESAVESKLVPAPGPFRGPKAAKEEVQENAWGWGDEGDKDQRPKKDPEGVFPAGIIAPGSPVEGLEQHQKTGETSVPAEAEEDEFDWANMGKKKKKGQVSSVSVPNNPDVSDAVVWGSGGRKKKGVPAVIG